MKYNRVVVVSKKTPLKELLVRHGSLAQAEYFLQSREESIVEYVEADKVVKEALKKVHNAIPREMLAVTVERDQIASFLFRDSDLIIACGPDGLFVNLAKYLDGQPVIAINPDFSRIDGVVMQHDPDNLGVIKKTLNGEADFKQITLAEARTNDGQALLAVNDFLVGRRDHASAKYTLDWRNRKERQSSSGVVISTGLGSSGWMKSILTMSSAISGGQADFSRLPKWSDEKLIFAVREPFETRYTGTRFVYGEVNVKRKLSLISEMPEGGVIISDGMLDDGIDFNSGCVVEIGIADKKAIVVL